jgi:hypothetical protein
MYGQQIGGSAAKSYEVQTEARQVEVSGAAADLEYNISELETLLASLASRLGPVLSNAAVGNGGATPSPGYSCDLAVRISTSAERLRYLRNGTDELLSRLEI